MMHKIMAIEQSVFLISYVVQLIGGLIFTYLLWKLAEWAEKADNRTLTVNIYEDDDSSYSRVNIKTDVFVGYADGMSLRNKSLDTISDIRPNYINLGGDGKGSSSGGSTFTYSFWILIRNPTNIGDMLSKGVLFLKGDPTPYQTYIEKQDPYNVAANVIETKEDVLVKSPMVSIYVDNNNVHCTIDMNTTVDIHQNIVVNAKALNLCVGQWALWTLSVAEEKEGCSVNFWVNDMPVHTTKLKHEAIRPNQGDLIMFPDTTRALRPTIDDWRNSVFISDMQYANFAFSPGDIREKLKRGVSKVFATIPTSKSVPDASLQVTTLNRLQNM